MSKITMITCTDYLSLQHYTILKVVNNFDFSVLRAAVSARMFYLKSLSQCNGVILVSQPLCYLLSYYSLPFVTTVLQTPCVLVSNKTQYIGSNKVSNIKELQPYLVFVVNVHIFLKLKERWLSGRANLACIYGHILIYLVLCEYFIYNEIMSV